MKRLEVGFQIKEKITYFQIVLIWLVLWGSYALLFNRFKVLKGRCIEVIDGDTILMSVGSKTERIRLKFIDAPESKQSAIIQNKNSGRIIPIGSLATEELKRRILNQPITVYFKKRDQFKRVLGEIYLKDESINLYMIRSGRAVIYWFAKFHSTYQRKLYYESMTNAQNNLRGMWRHKNFRDPYKWRKRLKRKSYRRSK